MLFSHVKISCFHAKACIYLFTSIVSLRGEGVKTTYAINIRVQMNERYCCILNVYMNISRNPPTEENNKLSQRMLLGKNNFLANFSSN